MVIGCIIGYRDEVRLMTQTQEIPPVMTIEEAAEILRVNPRTVLRRIHDGRLKAGRFGVQWRITREALLSSLEEQAEEVEQKK